VPIIATISIVDVTPNKITTISINTKKISQNNYSNIK
jgi:hypothetical protein